MPKHIENSSWKPKATDVAYKEPFSDATNKTRKLLTLWASIALLNHFYPIDLQNSHVLGLKFAEGTAPPIDGLLGAIVIYLFVVLSMYAFQEIASWLAQADIVALEQNRMSLHDIYAHHGNIHNAIKGATQQISNHTMALSIFKDIVAPSANNDIRTTLEKNLIDIDVHKISFENMCRNLSIETEKYGEEIEKSIKLLNKASMEYRSALVSQLVKVGVLEIMIPFILGMVAVIFSYESVISLIHSIAS